MPSTSELTAYFSRLRYEDLPPEVAHHAKRLVLDTLGCALGGSSTPLGTVAKGFAPIAGGTRGDASVVTLERPTTAVAAAGANGRMAGALDADDTFTGVGQTSHHGAGTVVAALALAERAGASGADLLTAVAAGAELGARFDVAVPAREVVGEGGWRVGGGPAGVLSAAVASSRVLGLDPVASMHAAGIAGAHVDVPPLKWFEGAEAPMVKSLDGGWNASTGVSAALLAELGMTGHVDVLDGPNGLWRGMGYESFDFELLRGDLGERWFLLATSFKRWPCQFWMQPALRALWMVLDEHDLAADEIESVVLRTTTRSAAPRFREQQPRGFVTCQFNFPHAAAMLALRVPPGPRWVDEVAQSDPAVAAFRGRVEVEVDPATSTLGHDSPDRIIRDLPGGALVRARGTTFTATAAAGFGAAHDEATRLSDDELATKFREMIEPLPGWAQRGEELIETVMGLDRLPDVRALGGLLRG